MDALRREADYTIKDIYALPAGQRAELIEGKIYYMAPPGWKHQRISGKLYQKIANYIESKNGECEVLAAPFAVFLNKDEINSWKQAHGLFYKAVSIPDGRGEGVLDR